ncbi:tRNA (guanosine(46)-N7)-methyltransferase TrmB [Isoptericola sp. NEAU-Y5]|uniref:tRNA (guanine-N(7)-)-methyltransferase n=1 Tax=Isoptericola luteus TaxID=2879484 RepID=A0ABS7ZE92_9MICO|nr:tRNA (guanosine(46)-N7)-methyltransferase TrmB [Isoptericola sp. NEAU-Y5]MCA5893363.1 tRNA (guanosine(46)-N7)-methyltransferase TrmB [Isoptericola sp. NEAU-Y5]
MPEPATPSPAAGRSPDPALDPSDAVVPPDGPRYRRVPLSFVRRSARLTVGQQRAWDTRRQLYVVDVPRDVAVTSVDPAWQFDAAAEFGRTAPLVVEIGSGQGDAVVHAATLHPERDHLAVEVYLPGLAQTIVRAGHAATRQAGEPAELGNLRLVEANAAELLATSLPPASVDELWVFFPDPWHKSRHHKRRLVTPAFAALAARVLRPGGTWRLATDWAEYAGKMLDVLEASDDFRNVHGPRAAAPRFEGRVLTSFETKGTAAGRSATDLEFVRL